MWATFLRRRQPEYDPGCGRERVAKGPSDQQSELEDRKPRDSSLNNAVVFFRSVLAGRRDLSVLSKVAVEAKFAGKDDRRRHEKPTRRSQGEHVTTFGTSRLAQQGQRLSLVQYASLLSLLWSSSHMHPPLPPTSHAQAEPTCTLPRRARLSSTQSRHQERI